MKLYNYDDIVDEVQEALCEWGIRDVRSDGTPWRRVLNKVAFTLLAKLEQIGKDVFDIEYKSTGTLLDEYITAALKWNALRLENRDTSAVEQRLAELQLAINYRVADKSQIEPVVVQLAEVLKECWDAQEVTREFVGVDDDDDWIADNAMRIARAGIKAQVTNAQRNKLIRQIDEILGEQHRGQLEKTYG